MLTSELFRGNQALEGASAVPAKHVVKGRRGDHVSKIQEALIVLDNAIILGNDISTQTYGESTADAVLAFKGPPRNIVNLSYQKAPDNIVGIMTMKVLDREMTAIEGRMGGMIEQARMAAFQRTFAAFMQVASIGPPGIPRRVDPNERNLLRATALARDIFNNQNPDMDDIANVLGDMRNRLMSKSSDRAHLPDTRIGGRDGFVVGNRLPIVLCPHFFATSDEQRIRTMVHESAHLTGIGDPDGEAYYLLYNSRNEPPGFLVGTPKSVRREDFADTWAKYVNAVTNQPADPEDTIKK